MAGIKETTWYRVTAWRKLAETCAQYLKKGRTVIVEGDLAAEAYADRDGKPQAKLVITATGVQFVGGGKTDGETEPARKWCAGGSGDRG